MGDKKRSHVATVVNPDWTLMLEDGYRSYDVTVSLDDIVNNESHGSFSIEARGAEEAAQKMLRAGVIGTLPLNLVSDHITITISRKGN